MACSFCGLSQENAGKLISSASHRPRVYICDQCVSVCMAIIYDDHVAPEGHISASSDNPRLMHPRAADLMAAIGDWIRAEATAAASAMGNLLRVREIAKEMMISGTGSVG
jgi:ATP-dependent protease Clp ATPase subunit